MIDKSETLFYDDRGRRRSKSVVQGCNISGGRPLGSPSSQESTAVRF